MASNALQRFLDRTEQDVVDPDDVLDYSELDDQPLIIDEDFDQLDYMDGQGENG